MTRDNVAYICGSLRHPPRRQRCKGRRSRRSPARRVESPGQQCLRRRGGGGCRARRRGPTRQPRCCATPHHAWVSAAACRSHSSSSAARRRAASSSPTPPLLGSLLHTLTPSPILSLRSAQARVPASGSAVAQRLAARSRTLSPSASGPLRRRCFERRSCSAG